MYISICHQRNRIDNSYSLYHSVQVAKPTFLQNLFQRIPLDPQRTPHFQVDVDNFQGRIHILGLYVDQFQRRTPFLGLYVDELLRRTPFLGLYVDECQKRTFFRGLYVDEIQRRTPLWLMNSRGGPPFLGCMLMNSRGGPPILRGAPPQGTISMDQKVPVCHVLRK